MFYINVTKKEWLLKVFKWTLEVAFIDRIHFTVKFFCHKFFRQFSFFNSGFNFTLVLALSHRLSSYNLLFATRKWLTDSLASEFYFSPFTNI